MTSTPPRLLPGRTAFFWQRRATFALFAALVFIPLTPLGAIIPQPAGPTVIVAAVVWLLIFTVRAFRASVRSRRAIQREAAAGYSTLSGQEFRHLWHLNPVSGEVLRRPDDGQ
jgi:hypothetical protein